MKKVASAPPHEVRILGGLWKRSKLPVANRPGLRPTPSRVRETLFNWLGQDLTGWRCMDAFAGTGALGFEAASRGATEVVLVESDPALNAQLLANRQRLNAGAVSVQRGDALGALRAHSGKGFDVVFLDPPFDAETVFAPALAAARAAVRDDGFVYLEAPRPWSEADLAKAGLRLHRHGRAGAVAFHLLRPVTG